MGHDTFWLTVVIIGFGVLLAIGAIAAIEQYKSPSERSQDR